MISWVKKVYYKLFPKEVEEVEEPYTIENLVEDYRKCKKEELIELMKQGIDPIPDDTYSDGLELIYYTPEENIQRIKYKAYVKHRINRKPLEVKLNELRLEIWK